MIANILPISVLSIFGTIISTIFIGAVFHFVLRFPLKQSLIFGAIITPTDPISVLALLKNKMTKNSDTGDNEDGITTILSGESLFNDGISLVLFEVFLGLNLHDSGLIFLKGNIINAFGNVLSVIGSSSFKFLYESIGGSILGILLGYLISFILTLATDYLTEIMISLLLAYASLIIAYYLNVSFIMAIIFSGIVLANYGFKKKVTNQTLEIFPIVIEYFAFIINSILFLIIGIEINLFRIFNLWTTSLFIIIIVTLSRFTVIYSLAPVVNKISNKFRLFSKSIILKKKYKQFLVFGGLRGALPIAMALSLPLNLDMRYEIITYVFIVVLFSLTIQAIVFDIFSKKHYNDDPD